MVTPDQPDPTVGALAGEVEDLRRRLDEQARQLDHLAQMPARIGELSDQVTELADLVTNLASTRTSGQSGRDPERDEPAAWSWLDLPTADDDPGADPSVEQAAADVLAGLADWLGRIYLRYPDAAAALPDCWSWHPDVVEELLALAGTWGQAYRSDQAGPALVAEWHDRHRPGVVARIRTAAGTCSLENHQPGGPHHHPATTVPLPSAVNPVAAWWAHRREETPPEPDPAHLAESDARRQKKGTRP